MFLTCRHGKTLQFPMGLLSAYLWVLKTHRRTEQSPEPLWQNQDLPAWRVDEVQLPFGHRAIPTAAAATAPGNRQR